VGGDGKTHQYLQDRLEAFEKYLIEEELRRNKGNITATYTALGLPRKTLYNKMKKYGLDKDDFF
jgi:two-component system C4-dicarboxylate transport response regulator DctD